jgi:GNAT superfamily N-acetyltransferase
LDAIGGKPQNELHHRPEETNMQSAQASTIAIIDFEPRFSDSVEKLVLSIQQGEFGLTFPREKQPDLINIPGVFQRGKGRFWVAVKDDRAVGTVGLVDIGCGQVALKKMFVDRQFRGAKYGLSTALLGLAKEHCRAHGISKIFLGTVGHFFAAHRFYEKNGFVEIAKADLPENFKTVEVDTKFYCCELG